MKKIPPLLSIVEPSPDELVPIFVRRRDLAAFASAVSVPPAERKLSQLDGERYPGAGRAKHLRVWHLAHDAGDPGATRQGRALLLTEAAWLRWHNKLPSKKSPPKSSPRSLEDCVLAELGGRRAS
jgi:hypothetical protein